MFSYTQNIEMTRRYQEHDLSSKFLEDTPPLFSDLTKNDLIDFVYPSNDDLWSLAFEVFTSITSLDGITEK